LFIAQSDTSELRAVLKRNIEASTQTRIVDDPKHAQATLVVVLDAPQKNILSLSSAGRVREFQLVRVFSFRVVDTKGQEFIPPSTIRVSREITFDDTRILAKESEEALLWRDIQNDLAQQLVRRLAAARLRGAD
jgi:LPS-assembly lipoprotein